MPAKPAVAKTAKTASSAKTVKTTKGAATATVKKPGCGSGSGGFKPGNTCGKRGTGGTGQKKRDDLAAKIRAARADAKMGGKGSKAEQQAVNKIALELKNHRRGNAGAIGNDRAKEYLAKIGHGQPKASVNKPTAKAAKDKKTTDTSKPALPKPETKTTSKSRSKPTPTESQSKPKREIKSAKTSNSDPVSVPTNHGTSNAKIKLDSSTNHAHLAITSKRIFDKDVTPQDIASMAGATHDAKVKISVSGHDIHVHIDAPTYTAHRKLTYDDKGKPVIHNETFFVNKSSHGGGTGLQVFGRQVENAKKHGVDRIETYAARSLDKVEGDGSGMVGYKVWPKFGYDGPLEPRTIERLPSKLKRAKKVSDLMKTPEGRDWWDKNGTSSLMSYDLKSGSLSNKVFDEYQTRKAAQQMK